MSSNIFIKEIQIYEVRHLRDIHIPISSDERKHLIITGRNGSGKTSLLNEIKRFWECVQGNNVISINAVKQRIAEAAARVETLKSKLESTPIEATDIRNEITHELNINIQGILRNQELLYGNYSRVDLTFNDINEINELHSQGNYIFAFFGAKRSTHLTMPNGIQKLDLKPSYAIGDKANQVFIQYLVNLKAQRSFARDADEMHTVTAIDEWFITFEAYLKELFDDSSLKLEFDSQNFDFNIVQTDKGRFNLNELSDGYSAIINIITELIMRMEKKSSKTYELQGVVLIDEVETHLHIDLQKLILPFLIKVFPKIQFIVTTHSPFVLNSISNAVVYDLENKVLMSNLSAFSVEGIIEGYFNADKYSAALKQQVEEYESLYNKVMLTEDEEERKRELKRYFRDISKFFAPELELKIQQIELSKVA